MRRRRPTQGERVLRALRRAGRAGITAGDFVFPPTIDDGPPFTRLASRINELRRAGYRIDTRRDPGGAARYVLLADASTACERSLASPAPPSGVTPPVGTAPPLSPYEYEADA